jgi:isoquinoline 1-oxidoreductase beta subunit
MIAEAPRELSQAEVRVLSRREFFVRIAGIGISVSFIGDDLAPRYALAATAPSGPASWHANAWITIDSDDMITIVSPASEMGQGIKTSLPLVVAEEMDADWQKVRVAQAPADAKSYGNPNLGGVQITGGSASTRGYYQPLRLIGAQTRRVILLSAAKSMAVPVEELTTEPSVVVHAKSGRRLTYGQVARTAELPASLAPLTQADLKPPAQWRYIGKDLPRVDIASKVDGSAIFGLDVQPPGLLHGLVLRAPVQGEGPENVDDSNSKAIPGFVATVRLNYGVGVIAESVWAARACREALQVQWSQKARARTYSSTSVLEDYQAIARDLARRGVTFATRGDAQTTAKSAARVITASYTSEHVHHATMEPPNATALVSGDHVEIWAPAQAQTFTQLATAHALQTTPDKVSVNTMLLGGGFGRKGETDFCVDAALLAKAVPGRPVKVMWTREDDVRHGKYRPLAAQFVQVGLDRDGRILSWQHRIVAESIFARFSPPQFEKSGGRDGPVTEGVDLPYDIPHLSAEYVREARGVDVGFWRAVGPGYTKFAVECMLDEIAAATHRDPVQMRIELLKGDPRARRVVSTVAQMADWQRKRQGSALGIAYSDAFGARCAQVAEVSLDRQNGTIRVLRVWCAIDPGVAIQPANIVAQMEGGIIHGVSHSLFEQVHFAQGEVQESNFHDYRVLRMSEIPEVEVKVVAAPENPPGGIGEAGLPPVGPAIANAVAALSGGARLRQLPFTPDRVKAALKL